MNDATRTLRLIDAPAKVTKLVSMDIPARSIETGDHVARQHGIDNGSYAEAEVKQGRTKTTLVTKHGTWTWPMDELHTIYRPVETDESKAARHAFHLGQGYTRKALEATDGLAANQQGIADAILENGPTYVTSWQMEGAIERETVLAHWAGVLRVFQNVKEGITIFDAVNIVHRQVTRDIMRGPEDTSTGHGHRLAGRASYDGLLKLADPHGSFDSMAHAVEYATYKVGE